MTDAPHTDPARMHALAADIDAGRPFAAQGIAGLAAAYDAQDALAAALAGRWGPLAGWKIAANSPALMAQLDLAEPAAARVFARTVHASGADCGLGRFTDMRIEPEIALRLAATPAPGPDGRITPEAVRAATAALLPAIELIEMRGATRESAPMIEAIAQNVSNIGAVLGGPGIAPADYDPAATRVTVRCNGDEIARAEAAAPQDPFEAVAWLANHLAARGQRLEGGQFILCGTHTAMLPVRAGDRIDIDMAPLGTVSARL